jgi:hypothetical protein
MRVAIAVAIIGLLICPAMASNDCRYTVIQYNSVLENIKTYLTRYANCLSTSKGQSDCSTYFQGLTRAQSEFVTAVLEYQMECSD